MPLGSISLEPFDPDLLRRLAEAARPGGGTQPPATGGSTNPTGGSSGGSPWPAWATAIDPNVQGWRTLDNGHLLHKATNKVYGPTGTFVASLSDYLAGEREDSGANTAGPPPNGTAGQLWTDPESGENWKYYTNLGWMEISEDPKNPNELPPNRPPADPGDGPIPDPNDFVKGNISPNWDPATGNFIGLPPPSNPGGGNQGNPMPEMPGMGVAPNSPYLGISRGSGVPTGQREAFKPWGQTLGYLSQALRYGGAPQQSQTGGYEGMDALMAAAQAAALRGEG